MCYCLGLPPWRRMCLQPNAVVGWGKYQKHVPCGGIPLSRCIRVPLSRLRKAQGRKLEKLAACSQDSASDPCVCGVALTSGWHRIWGPGAARISPLKTPLGPPHRHSYQTCFSSLLIDSSSHVSQVTAALLSDGLSASSMKPDSYKGWISSKRILIRKKKNPLFILRSFYVEFTIYCLGEIGTALC